ncbi:MAG: type I-U CRISPR-associated protein Cas7, partial [Methyloversatilis sp.]|nr:type I-U CRISPR-associated protein Cas7 [Methyloversatilis sp.]
DIPNIKPCSTGSAQPSTPLPSTSPKSIDDSQRSNSDRQHGVGRTLTLYQPLLPQVTIEAKLADSTIGIRNLLELGHRATDGAALASSIEPDLTRALKAMTGESPSPVELARLSPTSLLMGVWDSRKHRTGLKLPRAFSATIEASDVSQRVRHAQYNSAWHANQLDPEIQKAAGTKPSEIGLDGAVSGDGLGGVEVLGTIDRAAFLSATALRSNLRLGKNRPADVAHGHAADYIAALGLVALTMPAFPWLRSGCNLIAASTPSLHIVELDGTTRDVSISHEEALAAVRSAADKLQIKNLKGVVTPAGVRALRESVGD